jgi:hypothetical protein
MILQQRILAKLPLRPPLKLLVAALLDGIGAEFPSMMPEGFQQSHVVIVEIVFHRDAEFKPLITLPNRYSSTKRVLGLEKRHVARSAVQRLGHQAVASPTAAAAQLVGVDYVVRAILRPSNGPKSRDAKGKR